MEKRRTMKKLNYGQAYRWGTEQLRHCGGGTERQTAVGICVRYGPEHPARAW